MRSDDDDDDDDDETDRIDFYAIMGHNIIVSIDVYCTFVLHTS